VSTANTFGRSFLRSFQCFVPSAGAGRGTVRRLLKEGRRQLYIFLHRNAYDRRNNPMYDGEMISGLMQAADRTLKPSGDTFYDLCRVKETLANHRPMSPEDEALWKKADKLQAEVLRHETR
jgi:hypothetical protein